MCRIVFEALVWKRLVFLSCYWVRMVLHPFFWKRFQTITSENQFRGILQNRFSSKLRDRKTYLLESLSNSFLVALLKRDSNTDFPMNIAKCLRTALIEHLRCLSLSVWWSNCSVPGVQFEMVSPKKGGRFIQSIFSAHY